MQNDEEEIPETPRVKVESHHKTKHSESQHFKKGQLGRHGSLGKLINKNY